MGKQEPRKVRGKDEKRIIRRGRGREKPKKKEKKIQHRKGKITRTEQKGGTPVGNMRECNRDR